MGTIAADMPATAAAFTAILAQLDAAYPTALRPDTLDTDADALVSAVADAAAGIGNAP